MKNKEDIKEEVLKEEENKEVTEEQKNEEVKEEAHEHKDGEHACCGKHNHKEELEKLKAEVEEWKNSFLRKQAEFQNFTKRKEKEVERAIESSAESKDFDSLLKGIEMIIKSLKDIMSAEGVEEIKAEGAFDPIYHHAVGVEASEDKKEDEIVKVLQKGYMMKGKVIRPAMVIVCKK